MNKQPAIRIKSRGNQHFPQNAFSDCTVLYNKNTKNKIHKQDTYRLFPCNIPILINDNDKALKKWGFIVVRTRFSKTHIQNNHPPPQPPQLQQQHTKPNKQAMQMKKTTNNNKRIGKCDRLGTDRVHCGVVGASCCRQVQNINIFKIKTCSYSLVQKVIEELKRRP